METRCGCCDKQLGFMDGKIRVKDGVVCKACWKKAGFIPGTDSPLGQNYNIANINELIRNGKGRLFVARNIKNFGVVIFDDMAKKVVVKGTFNSIFIDYKDIVAAEILENGNSIQKSGIGGAAMGAVLLGPIGAVAGGLMGRKKENVCESLKIKITTKNNISNAIFIPFITAQTKIDGFMYKTNSKNCQEVMSVLEVIISENESDKANSGASSTIADELIKYKQLLDSGAITEKEYNSIKRKLLG